MAKTGQSDDIRDYFSPSDSGVFMLRHGPAKTEGPPPCRWKLCLTATDETYLANLLYEISRRPDCVFVKYSPADSPKSRDGMMLGRVFLTGRDAVGELWRKLYTDRKLMCSIQDDEATDPYR